MSAGRCRPHDTDRGLTLQLVAVFVIGNSLRRDVPDSQLSVIGLWAGSKSVHQFTFEVLPSSISSATVSPAENLSPNIPVRSPDWVVVRALDGHCSGCAVFRAIRRLSQDATVDLVGFFQRSECRLRAPTYAARDGSGFLDAFFCSFSRVWCSCVLLREHSGLIGRETSFYRGPAEGSLKRAEFGLSLR